MADPFHVCGAVAAAQAGLVLLELDIENPVQAVLDAPMGSGGLGEGFRREDARGDVASPLDPGLSARLDAGLDHGDGAEALEARLIGITPLAAHPVDTLGDMAARLDAAMGFLDLGERIDLIGGSVIEIELDLGVGGLLIVLGGQQLIAAEIDDCFGDVGLAAHGVDGNKTARKRSGRSQLLQQQG